MKNRDRYIINVNEYDMLISMQTNIVTKCGGYCVIDELTGKVCDCPEDMNGKVGEQSRLAVCSKCIQKWLNEEELR